MKISKIICTKGNPTAEEQAAIAAFFIAHNKHQKKSDTPAPNQWVQTARTEALNRWPTTHGDRIWQY